jgi:hypothetical protein
MHADPEARYRQMYAMLLELCTPTRKPIP